MSTDDKDKVDGAGALAQLDDLLRLHRRALELDLRVAMPATVLAYNPATQRADVQLGLVPVLFVGDDEVPQPPIVCPQVPVLWVGGSLGYVTTPLVPGDSGLVIFADRCLARWLLTGAPEDPINGRTHSLGDGIFLPGVRATPTQIEPPTDLTASVVEGPLVRLGSAASSGVVLDAGGAQAAIDAAIAALGVFTPAAIPPGTPVANDPTGVAAAAALNAIIPVLWAALQALVVSTKVYGAPAP